MRIGPFSKDPDEVLDYEFDFDSWLPEGDSVASAVSELNPVSPTTTSTAAIDQTVVATPVVTLRVSAGSHGDNLDLTVRASTTQGLVKEMCAKLKVRNC